MSMLRRLKPADIIAAAFLAAGIVSIALGDGYWFALLLGFGVGSLPEPILLLGLVVIAIGWGGDWRGTLVLLVLVLLVKFAHERSSLSADLTAQMRIAMAAGAFLVGCIVLGLSDLARWAARALRGKAGEGRADRKRGIEPVDGLDT